MLVVVAAVATDTAAGAATAMAAAAVVVPVTAAAAAADGDGINAGGYGVDVGDGHDDMVLFVSRDKKRKKRNIPRGSRCDGVASRALFYSLPQPPLTSPFVGSGVVCLNAC